MKPELYADIKRVILLSKVGYFSSQASDVRHRAWPPPVAQELGGPA